jgi:hypothetical protein
MAARSSRIEKNKICDAVLQNIATTPHFDKLPEHGQETEQDVKHYEEMLEKLKGIDGVPEIRKNVLGKKMPPMYQAAAVYHKICSEMGLHRLTLSFKLMMDTVDENNRDANLILYI